MNEKLKLLPSYRKQGSTTDSSFFFCSTRILRFFVISYNYKTVYLIDTNDTLFG